MAGSGYSRISLRNDRRIGSSGSVSRGSVDFKIFWVSRDGEVLRDDVTMDGWLVTLDWRGLA